MHFTPTYSSWLNQVERLLRLRHRPTCSRRGDHRSVQALEADIRAWVKAWNDNPKPFIWTKTADQILDITRTTYSTNLRRRTLGLLVVPPGPLVQVTQELGVVVGRHEGRPRLRTRRLPSGGEAPHQNDEEHGQEEEQGWHQARVTARP